MGIIYDSKKINVSPRIETKYFKVILDDRRELIMEGSSRRNIHKQLDEMIEMGDAFHKRVLIEVDKSVVNNLEN